jgi:hypothetical protein
LSGSDFQVLLLELYLDNAGRMLDDGSDPGALTRAILPQETLKDENDKSEEDELPEYADRVPRAVRWSVRSVACDMLSAQ